MQDKSVSFRVSMQVHKEYHEKGRFIHLSCLSAHMSAYVIFVYGQYIVACFLSKRFYDWGKIIMCLHFNLLCVCKHFVHFNLVGR